MKTSISALVGAVQMETADGNPAEKTADLVRILREIRLRIENGGVFPDDCRPGLVQRLSYAFSSGDTRKLVPVLIRHEDALESFRDLDALERLELETFLELLRKIIQREQDFGQSVFVEDFFAGRT